MSKPRSLRLSAFVLTSLLLLSQGGQASILVRELDGASDLTTSRPLPTLTDLLIAQARFTSADGATYGEKKANMHRQLETLGFTYRWQQVIDYETVSVWYSPALNTSVVCLEYWTHAGLTHEAYQMTGPMSRRGYFLW